MSGYKKSLGCKGEDVAVKHLQSRGLEIVQRNFRIRGGEIDIIAKDGVTFVFVEVKTRRRQSAGESLESISPRKIQTIRETAEVFLAEKEMLETPVRFDVMTICFDPEEKKWKAQWIKGAF